MAAIVTGAASGMGKAVAELLKKNGQEVIGIDKQAGPNVTAVGDIGTEAGVEALKKAVGDKPVKNVYFIAGALNGIPMLQMPREKMEEMVNPHILGPIFMTQALVPNLKASGGARIILTFGGGSDAHIPTFGCYGATKAAMKTLWLALRDECAEFAGVALAMPGIVKTPLWDPYLANKDWPFLPVFGPRFEGGDCHTAEECAQWFVAMMDPAKAENEKFKTTEWVIDNPDHYCGVSVTMTTEGKGMAKA